jgi:ribonuclease R
MEERNMAKNKQVKNKKPQRLKKSALMNMVVEAMQFAPNKTYNYKQLSAQLGLKNMPEKQLLVEVLGDLHLQEAIQEVERGKYKVNMRGGYVEGVIDRQANGKSYLLPDDAGEPVFIAERRLRQAMNKDRVKVLLYAKRPGFDPEGEVLEIIKRAQDTFVGILQVSRNYAFLRVDNKVLTSDIFIPLDKLKGGKDEQKAVVKIAEWRPQDRNPIGEVVDVLGDVGENNAEMHAILAEFGLPYKYPEEVERAADKIEAGIIPEEIAKRIDLRAVTTFTIDPRDAKDFDDALSMRKLDNGLWEVGVHIADVTHYVRPESIIEKEAEQRATSVYLVDRTIPMLPEHLSNGICSLRPNEEKLCYSVIFQINDKAEIVKYNIAHTVICSDRRFTYEEAQQIIETGEGDLKEEILELDRLAKILRAKRFGNGAIAFDRVEVRFEIDTKGKPLSVYFKEAKDSNKLIEEFMLLANKTVATHIGRPGKGQKAKVFVYRIHDTPNPEKLANLAEFIRKFGYRIKTTGKQTEVSSSINHLLDEVQGKKEQDLIETITIRSMAKAVYSTTNVGHYGLAFDYYTHFTSPIRRYPDMMVHRLLDKYLADGRSVSMQEWEEKCEHSSNMEQLAANAERASIKYKQVEFMSDKIGIVYDGVITGITEWGIYVELNETRCEGMIPIRNLDGDYYVLDEKNYCLIGRRSRRKFQLGDEITVKVVKANLEKKQLDFQLV